MQVIWIVIIMKLLRSLEMTLSLFTSTTEEGKDINQLLYYNIYLNYTSLSLCISCFKCLFSWNLAKNQSSHFKYFSRPCRFGKHSHDELSILVPLSQCCRSVTCPCLLMAFEDKFCQAEAFQTEEISKSKGEITLEHTKQSPSRWISIQFLNVWCRG